MQPPTALIAEDEPLLAGALQDELARAWPQLRLLACVGDGASAVTQALALQPDVLFLDIRMPVLSGLDAAAELVAAWPSHHPLGRPLPALVFVTAYDQYAVQAFETQAIDYLLKPVQPARLQKTVAKLRLALAARAPAATRTIADIGHDHPALAATLAQLRQLLQTSSAAVANAAPLQHIQVGVGNSIRLLPVTEVVYFEAADKYVRVLTASREYLIRTPLKELAPQLDASFWQVHRGTLVQANSIDHVVRDEAGRLWLQLRERPERLAVSRLYAQRFRAM